MIDDATKTHLEFIEDYLGITFDGDMNNSEEVELFVSNHLDDAMYSYNERICEYEAYYLEHL